MINVGMGAVFALGLLGIIAAIIIGASVVFFIISMIFLGFWIHRKVNKLDYQKVFKVSFIIYLALSIAVVGVPVGCVGITMADSKAERNTPPEDYINPGVELSVTASEIDDARGFEIDGVFYKRMSYDFYEYREDEVPIAKVKDEFENIYEVKNASGKRLLRYEGYIYCKESDMEFLEKFYTTLDDYDYYFYAYKGEKMKIDDFLDKLPKTTRFLAPIDMFYKRKLLSKTIIGDDFAKRVMYDFSLTPEGIRRSKMSDEEISKEVIAIFKDTFKKRGIDESLYPNLKIFNKNTGEGGSYEAKNHTLKINIGAYRNGLFELIDCIEHGQPRKCQKFRHNEQCDCAVDKRCG